MKRNVYRAVGERGQVTIPKRIRERLNIERGTLLILRGQRGEVLLRKADEEDPIAAVYGMLADGEVVACEVVWAESAARFPSAEQVGPTFRRVGLRYVPLGAEAAAMAGHAWGVYRRKGGLRERIASEFLIGAHAAIHADRLLTRDRGFYRRHFTRLDIVDPAAANG